MLVIRQDTKWSSIIEYIFKNQRFEFFLITVASVGIYIYNQSLILFFLPIFYLSISIWHYKIYMKDIVAEFHKKLMIYNNGYTQDEIIYYDHIQHIKIGDYTMGRYVNPYIIICIKEGLEFKYNNRKEISLFGCVNCKEVVDELNFRINK